MLGIHDMVTITFSPLKLFKLSSICLASLTSHSSSSSSSSSSSYFSLLLLPLLPLPLLPLPLLPLPLPLLLILLLRRYNSLTVLARLMIRFHSFLILDCFFQSKAFKTFKSCLTSPSHFIFSLPLGLKAMCFHSIV